MSIIGIFKRDAQSLDYTVAHVGVRRIGTTQLSCWFGVQKYSHVSELQAWCWVLKGLYTDYIGVIWEVYLGIIQVYI